MEKILNFVEVLMATSTPEAPAWNVEHTLSGRPPKWNYIDGCMIKAILDLYYATEEEKYFNFAKNYIDFYVDETGNIPTYSVEEYNCDQINMGKVLFDLYRGTHDERYKNAAKLLYSQVSTHPRISTGNFWHKKIYPHQVWLDGLYMVQPFYMEYENIFNEGRGCKDALAQFKNVYEIMCDPATGLMYHGYDESREMFWADKTTGLSPNFWTRSIGWYAMALVDTAEKVEENEALQAYLKDVLDALLKVADPETKMFYQVTNAGGQEGNYLETSGTCAIAYALMKGVRLGYLPTMYWDKGRDIFDAVAKHKLVISDDTFVLKDICLVAGLGGMPGKGSHKLRDGTYEYYISEPRVNNDAKGVAPFLFAYAEVLAKEKNQ